MQAYKWRKGWRCEGLHADMHDGDDDDVPVPEG